MRASAGPMPPRATLRTCAVKSEKPAPNVPHLNLLEHLRLAELFITWPLMRTAIFIKELRDVVIGSRALPDSFLESLCPVDRPLKRFQSCHMSLSSRLSLYGRMMPLQ